VTGVVGEVVGGCGDGGSLGVAGEGDGLTNCRDPGRDPSNAKGVCGLDWTVGDVLSCTGSGLLLRSCEAGARLLISCGLMSRLGYNGFTGTTGVPLVGGVEFGMSLLT
jgi:hypothetical protein